MPIYEYHCTHCNLNFEQLQKVGTSSAPCPKCKQRAKKLVSKTSFSLKGEGWYKDGYSKKKSESPAKPSSKKKESA